MIIQIGEKPNSQYAMLSMIQGEVVTRYGWVSSQEFTDIVAISQMTPGK